MEYFIKFYHSFPSATCDGVQFSLHPLRQDDLAKAIKLIADHLKQKDVLINHLTISNEEIYRYVGLFCQRSMEDCLGIICKDPRQKVVAVSINIDLYRELNEPMNLRKEFNSDSKMLEIKELFNVFKVNEKFNPQAPYDIIFNEFCVIDENYQNHGIIDEMFRFMMQNHPLSSKALVFMTEVTNGENSKMYVDNQYKVLAQLRLDLYMNKKRTNPFEDLEKTIKDMKAIPFERVCLMVKRR